MLSHNEYVILTWNKGSFRAAIELCSLTDENIVYIKDVGSYVGDVEPYGYACYSYFVNSMTQEQAHEIIDAAKNKDNRRLPHLFKKYFCPENAINSMEDLTYSRLTDMVSDVWFDSVKSVLFMIDDKRFKGYYEIDKEI